MFFRRNVVGTLEMIVWFLSLWPIKYLLTFLHIDSNKYGWVGYLVSLAVLSFFDWRIRVKAAKGSGGSLRLLSPDAGGYFVMAVMWYGPLIIGLFVVGWLLQSGGIIR